MNASFHTLKAAQPRRFTAREFIKLYESGFFGKNERLRLIRGGEVGWSILRTSVTRMRAATLTTFGLGIARPNTRDPGCA